MDENINYKELLLEMLEKKEYTKLRQTAAERMSLPIWNPMTSSISFSPCPTRKRRPSSIT